jgi:hypothetical protein
MLEPRKGEKRGISEEELESLNGIRRGEREK